MWNISSEHAFSLQFFTHRGPVIGYCGYCSYWGLLEITGLLEGAPGWRPDGYTTSKAAPDFTMLFLGC